MTQFVRPITAQEAILIEIRRLIVTRELPPGHKIIQEQLAQQLGVSRVPVREALKLLEGEGLIRTEPHRGSFVAKLAPEELVQILQLRRLLEADALTASVPALDERHFQTLEECIAEMDAAAARGDVHALSQANRRFHLTIIEPSGWNRYLSILNQLWDNYEPYSTFVSSDRSAHTRRKSQHEGILEALRQRDVALVTTLLDVHRMNLSMGTIERLAKFDEPDEDLPR